MLLPAEEAVGAAHGAGGGFRYLIFQSPEVINCRATRLACVEMQNRREQKKGFMDVKATDLTQRPPRSPRVHLGGYVTLPRMLDKCRATIAGKQGEYKYACPLDQRLLQCVGIDPGDLKNEVATGKGDGEFLQWIEAHAKNKHTETEIRAWSSYQEQRVPTDVESRQFLHELHSRVAPKRTDIATWFDLLDLDDYVSFGGQP